MTQSKFESVPIVQVNSKQPNREMGRNVYNGLRVTNGTYFQFVSKWLHVGTAGTLVFEQIDGQIGVVLNAEVGWHPIICTRVLASGTPPDGGGSVTTTATNVTYHGGTAS